MKFLWRSLTRLRRRLQQRQRRRRGETEFVEEDDLPPPRPILLNITTTTSTTVEPTSPGEDMTPTKTVAIEGPVTPEPVRGTVRSPATATATTSERQSTRPQVSDFDVPGMGQIFSTSDYGMTTSASSSKKRDTTVTLEDQMREERPNMECNDAEYASRMARRLSRRAAVPEVPAAAAAAEDEGGPAAALAALEGSAGPPTAAGELVIENEQAAETEIVSTSCAEDEEHKTPC